MGETEQLVVIIKLLAVIKTGITAFLQHWSSSLHIQRKCGSNEAGDKFTTLSFLELFLPLVCAQSHFNYICCQFLTCISFKLMDIIV